MPIEVNCDSCGQRLKAPDAAIGKSIRCPHCQNVMDVPAAIGPVSPAAVAQPEFWKVQGKDGTVYGPVPRTELNQWVAEGRIDAQTQILREGADRWQWASDIFPNLAAAQHGGPAAVGYPTSTSSNPFADVSAASNPYASGSSATGGTVYTGPQPVSGGVIAVAVVNFIFGGLSLLIGFCFLAGAGHVPMFWGARDLAIFMILIIIVFGVMYIAGGVGLLQRAQWGRVITFVLAGFSIVGIVFSFIVLVQALDHGAEEAILSQLISIGISVGYVILVFAVLASQNVSREFREHRSRRYRR